MLEVQAGGEGAATAVWDLAVGHGGREIFDPCDALDSYVLGDWEASEPVDVKLLEASRHRVRGVAPFGWHELRGDQADSTLTWVGGEVEALSGSLRGRCLSGRQHAITLGRPELTPVSMT
jgi:hypothetical protein